MKTYVPNYYPQFRCKAGACRKSCCIGWEIDIDADTLEFYQSVGGAFGVRLRDSIDCGSVAGEENAHFRLTQDERCPFLNGDNLCDIYRNCGEEHLCQICADHPRWRNYIGGRCETGLGLACEAVGELIFSQTEKTEWILLSEDDAPCESSAWEEELLEKRQAVLAVLQDRTKTLADRISSLTDDVWFGHTAEDWRAFYLGLERMEDIWEDGLSYLTTENAVWQDRDEVAWEQLLVYFVNRHLPGAADAWDCQARLGFALLGYAVIRTIYEGMRREKGAVTRETLMELARLYSAEIEYSEDNTAAVIEELDAAV